MNLNCMISNMAWIWGRLYEINLQTTSDKDFNSLQSKVNSTVPDLSMAVNPEITMSVALSETLNKRIHQPGTPSTPVSSTRSSYIQSNIQHHGGRHQTRNRRRVRPKYFPFIDTPPEASSSTSSVRLRSPSPDVSSFLRAKSNVINLNYFTLMLCSFSQTC